METIEFQVYEDFDQPLQDKFEAFAATLVEPCMVVIDIESFGGYVRVLKAMKTIIDAKKAEGFVFVTNVDTFAYSCGLFLFLMGDVKTCSDNADFLFHSAAVEPWGRVTSTIAREMAEELEACDEVTDEILAQCTSIDTGLLNILKNNENFLGKEDLIYAGLMEREYNLN